MSDQKNEKEDFEYVVLVEFAHKHLDFLLPELLSVLEMNGVIIQQHDKEEEKEEDIDDSKSYCHMLPLPNEERYHQETKAAPQRAFALLAFPSSWYHKGNSHAQLRPEKHTQPPEERQKDPEPSKEEKDKGSSSTKTIASFLSRCVLVRRVIELWGKPGTTIPEMAENTQQWIKDKTSLGATIYHEICHPPTQSWKLTIQTLGAKYTRQEHDDMRANFAFLDFPGKVQMKQPDHEFILIREMELDTQGNPLYPRHGQLQQEHDKSQHQTTIIPQHDQRLPLACYFGRVLWARDKNSMERYDLKNRVYLGPTSMDAELSFVMANLGQVQEDSVVLDPFVGTGSILVSCAIRGAYCVGTDIDIRVLRGKEENIYSNFQQFQLPRPELIRSDNAIYHRHFRTSEPWVDTIVTDPPYGIRAGARKSGSRLDQPRVIPEEHRHDHIPQTKPYCVADVMADLLDVAARALVMGGRMVYVIPSFAKDFNPDEDLPQHDCLTVIHLSFQPFTQDLGRRMVTMKKVHDYDPKMRETYLAKTWKNGPASAEKCANIREKLMEAAKLKPGYEEKSRVRKQKRKEHKEQKKKAKLEINKPQDGQKSEE
ncbi:guanine(10)-N2-methyltransferase homolog [Seminavis robusta]|uniref:tRNA (guanine(10)-N(2))-methyltransferase n=1 Tax=Seminavis robusta TaxID=568900 RepID=A0A9N8HUR0_9STRA|nr:guanine(10)-N2-methyltransferase homolog [Seminavis robusta]|eukprot:Sro1860_g302130.1 guanine(10)-N2)-methyltransferase homolog (596) ;mRNA; r:17777-19676